MSFKPDFDVDRVPADDDLWFVIFGDKLLLKQKADGFEIPRHTHVKPLVSRLSLSQYFGIHDDQPCHMAAIETDPAIFEDHGFAVKGLFELIGLFDEALIITAASAAQVVRWNKSHRFCGKCGNPTTDKSDERARECRDCSLVYYPRLSPAMIVAVVKDDKLLLARSGRFPSGFYSVLAGFVEPGETLEECVVREVYEEVGIRVKNVRYFGSQPWPFPDSLMLGFTAEYAGGEFELDPDEIADAGWYGRDDMPNIPPKISIARRLIDWYVDGEQ